MSGQTEGNVENEEGKREAGIVATSSLLRLFNSEFFDTRFAIYYLHLYHDKPGIQHFICQKLLEFPMSDIEYFMPQLCHLMLTKPKDSAAIEDLLIQSCHKSQHFAILLLYFLETYLVDLKAHPFSASSVLCQILYSNCKSILGLSIQESEEDEKGKIADSFSPALVTLGCTLATIGAPNLMQFANPMIVKEGQRLKKLKNYLKSHFKSGNAPIQHRNSSDIVTQSSLPKSSLKTQGYSPQKSESGNLSSSNSITLEYAEIRSPSLADLDSGHAFSYQKAFQELLKTKLDDNDEFSKFGVKSHYFKSQLSFMASLVDISERLVSVPKEARQSFLVAELSLLNHNLPANICLPLFCHHGSEQDFHHKLVGVSIPDAVVLNSAEKAPYLICFEVVESELTAEQIAKMKLEAKVSLPESQVSNVPSRPGTPDQISLPEAVKTMHNKALKRLSQTLTPAGSPSASPTQNTSTQENREFHVNYHKALRERRESMINILQNTSASLPPSTLASPGQSQSLEMMTEKLRTCAVMLAQLYQQQQIELLKLSKPPSNAPAANLNATKKRYQSLKSSFEEIRNSLIKEMMEIEEEKLKLIHSQPNGQLDAIEVAVDLLDADQEKKLHDDALTKNKDDPSAAVFKETWSKKIDRIGSASPYSRIEGWKIISVIVKAGDDLRQEKLALQLIKEMEKVWKEEGIQVWVYYYSVLITSENSGLVETIKNAISIHSIKKDGYARNLNQKGITFTLYDHFLCTYGDPNGEAFLKAQDCFMRSLAAYSVISYILQLKDRHNGNLLVDTEGHIIHIDFGFMLSNSPGSVGFELSPFKMPQEYIDILGGMNSEKFEEFKGLMKGAFLSLRRKIDYLVGLLEIMEKDSTLPCFTGGTSKTSAAPSATQTPPPNAASQRSLLTAKNKAAQFPISNALRERFHLGYTEQQISVFVDQIIYSSCNNSFTKLYDSFQYYSQGVF